MNAREIAERLAWHGVEAEAINNDGVVIAWHGAKALFHAQDAEMLALRMGALMLSGDDLTEEIERRGGY